MPGIAVVTAPAINIEKLNGVCTTPSISKRITPHKLRSTFGTNLYAETGDIYLVASSLGHEDVNTTTKHYAAIEEYQKQKAAQNVHLRRQEE